MSQMYPSSSHQLVAAAFRRARKKFPTNFGQFTWPLQYERKDSKSEQLQSVTTCKRCEQCLATSEIRNVRSSNVWPHFASSWTTDPRGTRSIREKCSQPRRRKVARTNCGGCDCRRICRSSKRNVVVSFSEEGNANSRCSGGDVAVGRSSIETMSNRSCRSRGRQNDCSSIERVEDAVKERTRRNEKKLKGRHRSCFREDDRSMNCTKIDCLNLLYDRNCGTKNSVSFSSSRKEPDVDNSLEEEKAGLDFPSKLHEWEFRSREDTIGSERRSRIMGNEIIVNCSCARNNGRIRNENYRSDRHHEQHHQPRFERNSDRHDSSLCRDLLLREPGSGACSTNEVNRLCKDCARGQCSRNSNLVQSLLEDEDEVEEHCDGRGDDHCAIKHKDSMAILAEKFKNKRNPNSCSDDETIFKSDGETSSHRASSNEKKIARSDREESEEFASEEVACCKVHGNNGTPLTEAGKHYKNSKSFKSRSGYCCSTKEGSCRNA